MKLILVCCLLLLATISAFSQTESLEKRGSSLTVDTLQKKIPAFLPINYFTLISPFNPPQNRNIFFGNNIYNQRLNLNNSTLRPNKWNDALSGVGQIFLSAFGQNNNHAYIYPRK